jgi:hypothetical protein
MIFRPRRSTRPAHALAAAPARRLPPILVHEGRERNETEWHRTETELATVIALMQITGLAAAGFQVAEPGTASINDTAHAIDSGDREKLMLAREAIREAACETGAFWSLPNPLLIYKGLAVRLFGDAAPGKPWTDIHHPSGRWDYGLARLAQVQAADSAGSEVTP